MIDINQTMINISKSLNDLEALLEIQSESTNEVLTKSNELSKSTKVIFELTQTLINRINNLETRIKELEGPKYEYETHDTI